MWVVMSLIQLKQLRSNVTSTDFQFNELRKTDSLLSLCLAESFATADFGSI